MIYFYSKINKFRTYAIVTRLGWCRTFIDLLLRSNLFQEYSTLQAKYASCVSPKIISSPVNYLLYKPIEKMMVITNYSLLITHYQLPITNYQLPITNYQFIRLS